MKYSGKLVLDPYYRFEKRLEELFDEKDSLDRAERRHAREQREMREFEEEMARLYGGSSREPSPRSDFLSVLAWQVFLFPSHALSLATARDFEILSQSFGRYPAFSFTIDDTPGAEVFEFAAGQDDVSICRYRREARGVTLSETPEKVFALLRLLGDGSCLSDPGPDPIETARRFSLCIGIPLLFGAGEKEPLLFTGMTRKEEAASRYAGLLDGWRPDLKKPEDTKAVLLLSQCRPLIQSRYLSVHAPSEEVLARFPYRVTLAEGPRPPVPVERIDPYAKTTCLHLFREDLPENALEDLIDWCESNSEDYQILVEDRFFGVWCEEWRGDSDRTAYFSLRDRFDCRMLGVWMHDDLFFSVTLWKSGQDVSWASFGCEESPKIRNPDLAPREFGLELELLKDYRDTEAFASRAGFFVLFPQTAPGTEKLRESRRGLVCRYPG